jgi:hypothetical protein
VANWNSPRIFVGMGCRRIKRTPNIIMPITQRDSDIMQIESEFKIQELLREWQRSFLTGRTGQAFPQQQNEAPVPEQGPEIQANPLRAPDIENGPEAPQVQEVEDGTR